MNPSSPPAVDRRPPTWMFLLAFGLVYTTWGTTYLAIKYGVGQGVGHGLPPALFGGSRILLAGLVLLGFMLLRGETIRLPWPDLLRLALVGGFMFVGGNWLISMGQRFIDSALAAVLVATTPLWLALLELAVPRGDRLRLWGWLGLLLGLVGVAFLFADRLPALRLGNNNYQGLGMLLTVGSAFCWAVGSVLLRHQRRSVSVVASTAYQMILGGGMLTVIGLSIGEAQELTPDKFTVGRVYAYFHLLIFGSLLGMVAYTWLLKHTTATLAGTYAYVNPMVAILVGMIDGETVTSWMFVGIAVILTGVAVIKTSGTIKGKDPPIEPGVSGEATTCEPEGSIPLRDPGGSDALPAPRSAPAIPLPGGAAANPR